MLIIGTYTCVIISRNNDPCSTRNGSPLDFLFVLCRYLLKPGTTWNDLQRVRNDLKQLTMCKKRPETIYHEQETTCNEQETTWNNSQRVTIYNDLNTPTTSKEKTRNDQQQANFQIILQYGANGSLLLHFFHPTFGCNHSSIASRRIMVKIERQVSLIMS